MTSCIGTLSIGRGRSMKCCVTRAVAYTMTADVNASSTRSRSVRLPRGVNHNATAPTASTTSGSSWSVTVNWISCSGPAAIAWFTSASSTASSVRPSCGTRTANSSTSAPASTAAAIAPPRTTAAKRSGVAPIRERRVSSAGDATG